MIPVIADSLHTKFTMIALWFISGLIGILICAHKNPHGLDKHSLASKIIFITLAICMLGPITIIIGLFDRGD